VEGRVTDVKPHEFRSPHGDRVVKPGDPVHDISVCLVIDADMVVHDVHAGTAAAPYPDCANAAPTLDCLKGLRIGGGFTREVRRRLGGAQGCTHMMELLVPMATAAYQSLSVLRLSRPMPLNADGRPVKIDTCFAYSSKRDLVRERWPEHYTGGDATAEKE